MSSAAVPTVSKLMAETIEQEMDRDPRVLVLGEDVATMGGVFNCTRGLNARFGDWRVRDTPISEMSFVGMGVGLALSGYRPIVEIMFADFLTVCVEQIVNAAAKIPYMSGGRAQVPMLIRTAGGSIGSAAQHSQCLWGMMAHWPGIQVIAPSCPADYRGLLTAAIRSDNPTILFEHKSQLNRSADLFARPDTGPDGAHIVPIGMASVAREGSDVTVVSISASVDWSLFAAAALEGRGISAEVIDLRSLVPLDIDTVLASVEKTGRLLVVDEDFQSFGMSGEIIARVIERAVPGKLRQVRPFCMPDVPLPSAKTLEAAVMLVQGKCVNAPIALAEGSGCA